MNKLVFTLSLIFICYVDAIQSICSNAAYGLYCTNLTNTDKSIIFVNNNSNTDDNIKAAFLKNGSGKISDETFALFPKVKSLDVQSSAIDDFETKLVLNNLYLMNNEKFPKISVHFFQKCCPKLMILFVFNNTDLIIENGAFQNLTGLKHLTISKQKIQKLTKQFLKGINQLTYLNLQENGIETVDENTFEDLRILNYLILSNNKITKFEQKTLEPLKELESFEFLGLDLLDFNISIFKNQKELKNIALPTKLIKQLKLTQLTMTFTKLETIILSETDKTNYSINKFILNCEDSGFTVKFA